MQPRTPADEVYRAFYRRRGWLASGRITTAGRVAQLIQRAHCYPNLINVTVDDEYDHYTRHLSYADA